MSQLCNLHLACFRPHHKCLRYYLHILHFLHLSFLPSLIVMQSLPRNVYISSFVLYQCKHFSSSVFILYNVLTSCLFHLSDNQLQIVSIVIIAFSTYTPKWLAPLRSPINRLASLCFRIFHECFWQFLFNVFAPWICILAQHGCLEAWRHHRHRLWPVK